MSPKTAYVAELIAKRMKARRLTSAPLQLFIDEARRIIMDGRESDYLTKLEMGELKRMSEDQARKKLKL